jgi:hypothetical protein
MTECTAMIGDVVSSRSLSQQVRRELQSTMERLMTTLDERFQSAVLSRFTITLGDEFQALFTQPQCLPALIWLLEDALPNVDLRLGVGFGTLTTPLKREAAVGMDGPAFHAARAAVAEAKARKRLGGVFRGFGSWEDRVLNGFAQMLWTSRTDWTAGQREVAVRIRDGHHPREIAKHLGITAPAVYNRLRGANWNTYAGAEDGWRAMLEQFDTSGSWTAS